MSETPRRIRLGVIVPSPNTALEPMIEWFINDINAYDRHIHITVHFSRVRVPRISFSVEANSQYMNLENMLAAAESLADAEVNVISWGGTSASWLGFEIDETLCTSIERKTGIPATTSVLAMNEILLRIGAKNVGLVTPYSEEVTEAILKNYSNSGYPIEANRSSCRMVLANVDSLRSSENTLDYMMQDVTKNGAKYVLIMDTNLATAHRARFFEEFHEIVVLDSVTTTVLGMLEKLKEEPNRSCVQTWGSICEK